MKKITLVLTALFVANIAFADEATQSDNLTLAAADLNKANSWVETKEDAELRLNEQLAEKADSLSAKINAKLEKQLEEKLAAELNN